ncbi:sugar ABC transporter ATP-binding protein [Mesorhizobium amorphae]|uniref:ABC transporter n=1 Tax=Mesorhizobium amorphae CCNWGS0123 TaxID=1082933 RepID=G6YLA9_9HYPH|nr:sugar ABC transporter ATP-binding protein [Mesorhizobium amorphae]ANT52818.1 D-xylose ABC transporter ATP-binding protein [Mesorhizobium amorphae CCNWGS0123]EHH02944.1 ABC transporter [Mesorhizobium amorphae CCNWGS0123]GLR45741.1 ribose import ATP-binding protein RbsA [Mesorhizobium amorphae]
MSDAPVLQIRSLSKAFGPVHALSGVQFELRRGEVHALCGENGAGKSTLMNMIGGILQPDEGDILIDGKPVTIASPAAAQKIGIALVHQEIALCQDATVAENICMAAINARRAPLMNFQQVHADAEKAMNRLAPIAVRTKVADLSISSQQLVEIAKALTLDCKVLILDEPTAALTETEAQRLFAIVRGLKQRGISVIYISHRMAEIFSLCDRVTVFRDGRYVATEAIEATSPNDVVRKMVGREITQLYPDKLPADAKPGRALLSVSGLSDGTRFANVDLELRTGEILGIGGLIGAGRSEIAQTICGLRPATAGSVVLDGKNLAIRSYADAVRAGLVYLSEDRKRSGVFLDLSIAANVSALDLGKLTGRFGLLDRRAEADQATSLARQLGVRMSGIDAAVSTLSGGNQQKVAIAKQLSVAPKVIIMDEPTRGIDVGAKVEIHRLLRDLANRGVGIIVISSELPELIGLCDRVAVVREGRIAGVLGTGQLNEETIIMLASGVQPNAVYEGQAQNVA